MIDVRGRIDLDGNAQRVLRELRRDGVRTQRGFEAVGRELDKVGDREDQRRLRTLRFNLRGLGRTSTEFSREYRRGWQDATREVGRAVAQQGRAIDELDKKVTKLGEREAKPEVALDGTARAHTDLTALERRLDAFERRRAVADVAVRGGGGGGGRPRGVIGGIGPGGPMVATQVTMGKLLAALPVINTLVGATTAIIGSAGQAALGAGALGVAGAGGAIVGGAGTGLAAKGLSTAIKGVTEAQKEQKESAKALAEAISEHGAGSDQAAAAQKEATAAQKALNKAYQEAPEGTRLLLARVKLLKSEFQTLTRPGQSALAGSASRAVLAGRRGLRRFGADAINRSARASGLEGERLASFMTGRVGERFATSGAAIYAENLGEARESLEHIMEAWTNIQEASRPYFREAMEWLSRWTQGWADGTSDIKATRREIGEMIDHLRDWKDLAGATFGLMGSLLGMGAPPGGSAVRDLTEQLREWDEWVERNPEEVREFFRDSIESAKRLASAIYSVVSALGKLGEQLRPVLDTFSNLVSLADKLGLLTPGAVALAYGAYKGGRAGIGAKGAVAAGAAGAAGVAGAGALRRARGAAGGAARGAARRFAPVALGLGALEAITTRGSTSDRVSAGFSTATLGAIPRRRTVEERQRAAQRKVNEVVQTLKNVMGGVRGLRDAETQVKLLEGSQRMARSDARARPGRLERLGRSALGVGGAGIADKIFGHEDRTKEAADQVKLFGEALRQARDRVKAFNERLDDRSRSRAAQNAIEFQERYTNLQKRGRTPQAAFADTIGAVKEKMDLIPRMAGKRELATATLEWAQEVARGRPKMLKEVRTLERQVIERFGGMAKQTATINGQIMVGTKSEWGKIADALGSAANRGVSEVSAEFKRLRAVALGALRDMGFSETEARTLFQHRGNARVQSAITNPAQRGNIGKAHTGGALTGATRATGGRLPGKGRRDTVLMSDGGLGAPDELVINRHTEGDHDKDARQHGLPTLAERVAAERRHHSDPMQRKRARGGRVGAGGATGPGTGVGGGGGRGIDVKGSKPGFAVFMDHFRRLFGNDLYVMSGLRPGSRVAGSGRVSNHATGDAVDISNPISERGTASNPPPHSNLDRLHTYIKQNIKQPPRRDLLWRTMQGGNHYDHIHWGMDPSVTATTAAAIQYIRGLGGAGAGAFTLGATATGAAGQINLTPRTSRLGGVPGALSNQATRAYTVGLEQTINQQLGAAAGGVAGAVGGATGTLTRAQVLALAGQALQRTGAFPNTAANRAALADRARQESGYNAGITQQIKDVNSGGNEAVGLMQIIPGTFATHRDPNLPNDRRHGLASMVAAVKYMKARYGRIMGATGRGYARGGRIQDDAGVMGAMDWAGAFKDGGSFTTRSNRPAGFVAGEGKDKEEVTVRRVRPGAAAAAAAVVRSGNTGRSIVVHMNFGDVRVADGQDFEKHAERAAQVVAEKLLERLNEDTEEAIA